LRKEEICTPYLFAEKRLRARLQNRSATEPDSNELFAALAGLDDSFDESLKASPDNRSIARSASIFQGHTVVELDRD
jgi:hypothetical protein